MGEMEKGKGIWGKKIHKKRGKNLRIASLFVINAGQNFIRLGKKLWGGGVNYPNAQYIPLCKRDLTLRHFYYIPSIGWNFSLFFIIQ